jgi:multiple sugar transport system substrate-binding protein
MAAAMAGCLPGSGDSDGDGSGSASGSASGSGGTQTETSDPANQPPIHFLTDYYNDAWQARWEELRTQFEDETGIGIELEETGLSGQGQESRLAQLVQSGDPPDANTGTFDQVAEMWANDQLEPVNGVVEDVVDTNGDFLAEPYREEDGDIYQVSHGTYVSNFHYRKDIFDDLGLSPPSTLQETLDNARAIDESDKDVRGYGLAGQRVGKSQDEYLVYAQNLGFSALGVRWRDPDARNEFEVYWPEEKITRLLQWFKDISQYSPDPTSIGWAEAIGRWVQGHFAQQYHLNIWPQGVAAKQSLAAEDDATSQALNGLARATGVQALPTSSDIDKTENWMYEPTPDGYHVMANGSNTQGAKEWFRWLYADGVDKTASLYAQEPSRFLPTYGDILGSDAYQNLSLWQEFPFLLDQMKKVQNTVLADHYGNVPESDLNDPVALYLARQWFYGEMVNRVVTESNTIQETYEWGREQLDGHLQDARDTFR